MWLEKTLTVWLMFYYCWSLDRKFRINYKAKILKSSYQRWTWTSWDCFELLPSQQKGSCPIWWAWNDSPRTASHPPNPRRLCGFPASLVSVLETRICLSTFTIYGGEFASHVLWIGSHLHCPHQLLPIHGDNTCITPSLQTRAVTIRTHWLLQRMQGNPSQWHVTMQVTRKERSVHSTSSESCSNIGHITKFLNTRGQKYALNVIWAVHPFGFISQNFVSSTVNTQEYQSIYSQGCNSEFMSKNQW